MSDFKFQIGEFVYIKVAIESAYMRAAALGERSSPPTTQIVGRLKEECHGGVQTKYILSDGLVCAELELAPTSEFSIDRMLTLRREARRQEDLDVLSRLRTKEK